MKTIFILATACLLCACSSIPHVNHQYDAGKSMALNVSKAAGIDKNLQDFATGEILALSASGYGHFNNIEAGPIKGSHAIGAGVLSRILAPEATTSRNLIFGWDGTKLDSRGSLLSQLSSAFEKTASELSYRSEITLNSKGQLIGTLFSTKDETCKKHGTKREICFVVFTVQDPKPVVVGQSFIDGVEGKQWFYDPSEYPVSSIVVNVENTKFDSLGYLQEINRHLPSWVHFYLAPKMIVSSEQLLTEPLVVRGGEVMHFTK